MSLTQNLLLSGALILALIPAGCGSKKANLSDAEKSLAETEKQLQQAMTQPGSEQRVQELEKKLAQARKELVAARGDGATGASAPASTPEPPASPKPRDLVIEAGTPIAVRTTTALSTKTASTGATFAASLVEPLTVEGVVLAPAGSEVTGTVLSSDPGGRVKGKASIAIALKSLTTSQGSVAIQTSSYQAVANSTVKKDVVRTGIMAGAGAAIGAIAGGGRGAAIGAGIGGGAGVGTAMATRGAAAVIPAESALTFKLTSPVTVTVQP